MLKLWVASVALIVSLVFGNSASAASYIVTITGQISHGYSVDRNFNQIPNPASTLQTGDTFLLTYLFDTADSSVTGFYDVDPAINIYYGQATNFNLSIGIYSLISSAGVTSFLSTQLWDNYNVAGGGPTDLFGQSVLQQLTGPSPIDLGAGPINFSATLNAFDFTSTARSSDLLSEIPPLTAYANKGASFGFLNASTYVQTSFSINGLTASVNEIAPVPEPATWLVMIGGLGSVGLAMRRRRRPTLTNPSPARLA